MNQSFMYIRLFYNDLLEVPISTVDQFDAWFTQRLSVSVMMMLSLCLNAGVVCYYMVIWLLGGFVEDQETESFAEMFDNIATPSLSLFTLLLFVREPVHKLPVVSLCIILCGINIVHYFTRTRLISIYNSLPRPENFMYAKERLYVPMLTLTGSFFLYITHLLDKNGSDPMAYFILKAEFANCILTGIFDHMSIVLRAWDLHYKTTDDEFHIDLQLARLDVASDVVRVGLFYYVMRQFWASWDTAMISIYYSKLVFEHMSSLIENFCLIIKLQKDLTSTYLQELIDKKLEDVRQCDLTETNDTCIVCLDTLTTIDVKKGQFDFPKKAYCGHNFHLGCITDWTKKSDTCPICRVPLELNSSRKAIHEQQLEVDVRALLEIDPVLHRELPPRVGQ